MSLINISNYFFNFKENVTGRLAWPNSLEQDNIFWWRAQLLFIILSVSVILGSFALIPAVTLIVKEGAWILAIVDVCALLAMIALLTVPRIPYKIRASIVTFICYLIGITVILSVGPLSGGPIWLFSFAIMSSALLGNLATFIAIFINTASLILIGMLMYTGTWGSTFPFFGTPQAMITAGACFFILSTITSISVSYLLKVLNESEQRYRLIAENVTEVIWTMDMDLKFTFISPSVYQQRGYTVKEAMNQPLDQVLSAKSFEKSSTAISEKLDLIEHKDPEGWEPVIIELEQNCKNGTMIWSSISAKILPDEDGNPKSILGVTIDITDRKKSDKKLKQSEEKFRTAFRTSPYVITLTSVEDGNYVEVNDSFTRLLGYTSDEIIGKSSLKFNIWNDSKDRDLLVDGLKKNGIVENLNAEFKGKDGQIIDGIMSARTLNIDDKSYFLAVTQDVTELKENEKKRKELETQLQQTQKMESIGTLAGGIAHDFNNILFPIIGHTEMLLEDVSDDSPYRWGLNGIYTGAIRAKELIKQILTFSRQENSELKLIRIQPIIKEALKLIRHTIPTTIEIKQAIQTDCGPIKADPTQLHQIIMNLSTNAYHAMEETGGELNIRLKEIEFGGPDLFNPDIKPAKYARLSISDTGKGMNKDTIKKIFDPFFTTKETGKGTGMGLSVVHGIVKSMNGTIKVDSKPDKGTEFHINLPVFKSFAEKYEFQAKKSIQNGTERILLVDDEESIVTMEKNMLKRLGYQVSSRTSSFEALEAFRASSDKFDMVITDMQMPGMSGDKFAGELTKIRPDIPILLCTGFSETMTEETAESLGIRGFLLKPIKMKDFSHKIREVLDEN